MIKQLLMVIPFIIPISGFMIIAYLFVVGNPLRIGYDSTIFLRIHGYMTFYTGYLIIICPATILFSLIVAIITRRYLVFFAIPLNIFCFYASILVQGFLR